MTTTIPTPASAFADASGPDASWWWIGPEEAEELLGHNTRNRNLRPAHRDALARDMTEGRWKENAAPVQVAADGTLLDGQHRLSAIVKSGVRLKLLLVTGLPKDSQHVMDSGAKRTVADALRIDGVPDATKVASAARAVIMLDQRHVPTHTETVAFAREHAEQLACATRLGYQVYRDLAGSPSSWAAAAWRILAVDHVNGHMFLHLLASGEMIGHGHPAYTLRRKLRSGLASANNPKALRDTLAPVFKAFNLWGAGKSAQVIRVDPNEHYPWPRLAENPLD
ncbi:hypothetical protein Srot_1186 [Segniliparus rotundus DSM 44985]|uniref:ParB/Sulfiredoxin domain-containing protein n=1 Tax=Segniliparus rotundus (strain ATCC BAA-972 / CDC 1076 / CIP 108378 / DSM 44985 / JCM 13578) TaxID=640132 RepID=D6ZFD3_SEGRD|nr:hypothetical protein [Segniliparus rotundus]ADG97657.1 hypothetical protein Srot_1186 [Segniliparus rotundus DSM 44985]